MTVMGCGVVKTHCHMNIKPYTSDDGLEKKPMN